jgi:hypothetical protein
MVSKAASSNANARERDLLLEERAWLTKVCQPLLDGVALMPVYESSRHASACRAVLSESKSARHRWVERGKGKTTTHPRAHWRLIPN